MNGDSFFLFEAASVIFDSFSADTLTGCGTLLSVLQESSFFPFSWT